VAHDIECLFSLAERICFLSEKPAKVMREKYADPGNSKKNSLNYPDVKEAEPGLGIYYVKKEVCSRWN
jgi:ABC-type nitrate/sulfonate/bicarbonate transport system ATPase subunit